MNKKHARDETVKFRVGYELTIKGKKHIDHKSCRDCECFYKIEEIKIERGISIKNNQFYMIALNISGQRERLEKKAAELINKHGYLRALKITKAWEEIIG